MTRAVSVTQLYTKKRKLLNFDGDFLGLIGQPELKGTWFVWGQSGSGKTSFMAQLSKYMTRFGRVAYNSLEEGDSHSMKLAFMRAGMDEVKRKIILLNKEPIAELKERLRKHKAPNIVIIDSIQYSRMTYSDYIDLVDEFHDVLFIIVSHANGKNPKGNTADSIRYDAMVKIWIEGYRAFAVSRYGGGIPYTIYKEGADKYYGDIL